MTINLNTPGSIPQIPASSWVLQIIHAVALDTRPEPTTTYRKIAQIIAQRKRLRENAKTIMQRVRIQTENLRLTEQEIDNIDLTRIVWELRSGKV